MVAARVEVAASLWAKFMGLMGRATLEPDAGLWLPGQQRHPHDVHALPDRRGLPRPARSRARRRAARGVRPSRAAGVDRARCRSSAAPTASSSCRSARSTGPGRGRRRHHAPVARARHGPAAAGHAPVHRRMTRRCSGRSRPSERARSARLAQPRHRLPGDLCRLRPRGRPDLSGLPAGPRRPPRAAGGRPDRPAGRPARPPPPARMVRAVRRRRPRPRCTT